MVLPQLCGKVYDTRVTRIPVLFGTELPRELISEHIVSNSGNVAHVVCCVHCTRVM